MRVRNQPVEDRSSAVDDDPPAVDGDGTTGGRMARDAAAGVDTSRPGRGFSRVKHRLTGANIHNEVGFSTDSGRFSTPADAE